MTSATANPPLISVLMPIYNHEAFVRIGLDSVVQSRHRPVEIVAIDDGSTDQSFAIAEAWKASLADPLVTMQLLRQENQGLVKTLNRQVRLARGQFFALLASDDFLQPDGLGMLLDGLQKHPEWMVTIGDAILVDQDGQVTASSALADFFRVNKRALLDRRFITREMILRWGVPGGAIMIRRNSFHGGEGIGFYDESLPFEDRDYFLKLLARSAVGFVDAPVSGYRRHSANFFKVPDREKLARYYRGLHQAEVQNLPLFRGGDWLGLRLTSWMAWTLYQRTLAPGRWFDFKVKLLWILMRMAYWRHERRVAAA